MFLWAKRQQKAMIVYDGIMVEHLRVDLRLFRDQSDEVSEVSIGDVDHRRDRECSGCGKGGSMLLQGGMLLGLLFHIFLYFFYKVNNPFYKGISDRNRYAFLRQFYFIYSSWLFMQVQFLKRQHVISLPYGILTVIIIWMDSSKQTTLITFNKKVKSPYALQYLQFQQRLKGSKRAKQRLPALPSNQRKSSDPPQNQNYLDLAHELIHNKQRIWFGEDKENRFPTIESGEEAINSIKEKLSRIKNRSQQTHLYPRTLQQSQELTKQIPAELSTKSTKPVQPPSITSTASTRPPLPKQPEPTIIFQAPNMRSRVHSEAIRPPSSGKQSSVVTFLQYKKSKRELSMRLKRDANQR